MNEVRRNEGGKEEKVKNNKKKQEIKKSRSKSGNRKKRLKYKCKSKAKRVEIREGKIERCTQEGGKMKRRE